MSDAACAFPEGGFAEGGLAGLVGICRRQRVCICRLRRELEIIKKAIVTPFFLLAIPYGPSVLCYVAVLHAVVDITCSTYCLKKFLGIELRQYASVAKYFFLSLVACAPALVVCRLSVSPWVSLSVGVVSAGLLYWALLHRDEHMKACVEVLMEAVGKRK